MAAGLLVHADPIGPGIGKGGNVLVRVLDHQVAIERQPRRFAQAFYQRRAKGDVGHKMPVHHIHMDCRSAAPLRGCNLVG